MTCLGLDRRRREQQLPEKPVEDAVCAHTRPRVQRSHWAGPDRSGRAWGLARGSGCHRSWESSVPVCAMSQGFSFSQRIFHVNKDIC